MVEERFLAEKEKEKILLAESLRQQEKEKKKLSDAERYLKSRTTMGRLASSLNTKNSPRKVPNYRYPTPQTPNATNEQRVLQGMFSGNNNWGTGQNLPVMNGVLITGNGLIKNGDTTKVTASFFGMQRR